MSKQSKNRDKDLIRAQPANPAKKKGRGGGELQRIVATKEGMIDYCRWMMWL